MRQKLSILLLAIVNLLTLSGFTQVIKSDLISMNLKGKVRLLTQKKYLIDYKFGKEQKVLQDVTELNFNVNGNIASSIGYNGENKLIYKLISKYDKGGLLLEISKLDWQGKLVSKVICNNNYKDRIVEKNEYESNGDLLGKNIYSYNVNWEPVEIRTYSSDGILESVFEYSYKENVSQRLNDGDIHLQNFKVNEKTSWSGSNYFDGRTEKSISPNGGSYVLTEYYTDGSRKRFITVTKTQERTIIDTGEIFASSKLGWIISNYNNRGKLLTKIYYNSDGSVNKTELNNQKNTDRTIESGNYLSSINFDNDATITQIDQYDKDGRIPVSTVCLFYSNKKIILKQANDINEVYRYDDLGFLIEEVVSNGQRKIIYNFKNDSLGNHVEKIVKIQNIQFSRVLNHQNTEVEDNKNEQKKYEYDSKGNIIREIFFELLFEKPTPVKVIESTIIYY